MKRFLSHLLLLPIHFYRRCISPLLGPSCRFVPTCSQYAIEAIKKHGPFYGLYLTIHRLLRCHPWGGSGYDPVPSQDLPIDIHTHRLVPVAGEAIMSYSLTEKNHPFTPPPAGWYSAGIHPWHIQKEPSAGEEAGFKPAESGHLLLEQIASWETNQRKRLLAIGEAGLDKLASTPLMLQSAIFEQQALLAEQLKKPLIIHLVRATDELLQLRKKISPTVPWIIHGFRGNAIHAEQLLKQGLYLSFGEKYQEETLRITPIDRLFLETDESQVPIAELYNRAARVRGISPEELLQSVRENVQRLFFQAKSW